MLIKANDLSGLHLYVSLHRICQEHTQGYEMRSLCIYTLSLLRRHLEALAMNDGWAGFVVLLLGDPHLLEGGERGQNGATNPHRVLALRGSHDLDLHGRGGQCLDLLLHAISHALEHGGATFNITTAIQYNHSNSI